MKNPQTPTRPSHGGGRPRQDSAIYEASETVMEGQAILMDLRDAFARLLEQAQEQLRRAQELLLAGTAVAQPRLQVA